MTTFDDGKLVRLKDLIDQRWALQKASRRGIPRDEFGLMKTDDLMEADESVKFEQDDIRRKIADIGESLRDVEEMLDYMLELNRRDGTRYGDALDHLWDGVQGWIE